jgi:Transcriptional regulation of mitochondrial recombination
MISPAPPRNTGARQVEAFGKLRDPASNAAKAERERESRKIEKALRREGHGESVYAYVHIGTGQVVYSLTRIMDVSVTILKSLCYTIFVELCSMDEGVFALQSQTETCIGRRRKSELTVTLY